MASRYTVLEKQQETKLLKGCPVLIDAIGITKDEKTGQILAQVKLQNLSPKAVIGCKIRIDAFQISKEPLEGVDSFSYLDMTVKQGEFFGSQTPVNLPDNRTRQIKVSVSEVVFEDQAIWKYETGEWETPPSQDKLFPNDDELLKEYTTEVGGNVQFEPEIWNGFFLCTCGTINLEGQACHKCKRTYEALFSPLLNEETLRENAKERQKEALYKEGLLLKERKYLTDVEKAKEIFVSLADYKDAETQIAACNAKKEELLQKEEERKKEEALQLAKIKERKKKKIRFAIWGMAALAFVIVFIFLILPAIKGMLARAALKNPKVGSTVILGTFEQDNNLKNGEEEIEWIVLAVEDNKALLISKYALDCQRYHYLRQGIDWEKCSLRKWLNKTFYEEAFNVTEKKLIANSIVTEEGNNTTDKIFLLSVDEANKYFNTDAQRQCKGTSYCFAQGAFKNNQYCSWWLRSPGKDLSHAASVDSSGSIRYEQRVSYTTTGVRPVLWIDFGS